ncbi:YggT family protein [Staphylococcus devriesei]|uniref:YggT family protein n=1 Tax=Staphylococcus devriesei TaxID=586733 RepID=UPI001F305F73|nr:YggT family protein [Staphylococcus devriesei]MCE5089461.1 YggT family protein [Staphylococcus devriesei]
MDLGLLSSIFSFILFLVKIYYFGMIIYFFTSWVPSLRESKFGDVLGKLYEPFLEPFRKIIPPIGMIDISSLVALFVLILFQAGLQSIFSMIIRYLMLH